MSKPICQIFLLMLLTLAGTSSAFAQELDEDCRPIPLPTVCQPVAEQLAALEGRFEQELRRLRNLMVHVSSSQRAEILQMIEDLQQERASNLDIARLANELQACKNANIRVPGRPVAPAVLDALFTGRVITTVFQTPPQAPTQTSDTLTIGLQFSRNRCDVTITNFPPINSANSVVVTKSGGGSGKHFPDSGGIEMPLNLAFAIPFVADSRAETHLSTGTRTSPSGRVTGSGIPLAREIDTCVTSGGCLVALFGTTVFQGGPADGQEGSFLVTGTIARSPAPPPPSDTRIQCLNVCDDAALACLERSADPDGPTRAACADQRTGCRSKCPR